MVIAVLIGLFIFVSHLPILAASLRQFLMIALVGLNALIVLFRLNKIISNELAVILFISSMILLSVAVSNQLFPSLTEYADKKRSYFYLIFLSSFLIFPLSLKTSPNALHYFVIALSTVSFVYMLLAFTAPTTENIRRSGIEINPALHAKLLFFPLLWVIATAPIQKKASIVAIAVSVFSILACMKTGTRGPILVILMIYLIDQAINMKPGKLLTTPIIALIGVGLLFVFLSSVPDEISARFTIESLREQQNEGNRFFLYGIAWSEIVKSPQGIGMGNFSAIFWVYAPHNIFLEALLDLGLLGALPLFLALGICLWKAVSMLRGRNPTERFFALWFLFFFLNAQIGGELSFPSMLLYLPMGILIVRKGNRPAKLNASIIPS